MLILSHNTHWTVVYEEKIFSLLNKYNGYKKNIGSNDKSHYFYSQMCRGNSNIRVHFNHEIAGVEFEQDFYSSSNNSHWKMIAVTSNHLPVGRWWLFEVEDLDVCINTIVYADITDCSCSLLIREQRIRGATKIFC